MFLIRLTYNWILVLILIPLAGGAIISLGIIADAYVNAKKHDVNSQWARNEAKSLLRGSEWLRLG